MAVPDTTTFSLQDVVTDVNPTTDDLVDCFADANINGFDPNYYATGDDLLEFRNYCYNSPSCTTLIFAHYWNTFSQPQNACIQTVNQGRYIPIGTTYATTTQLFQDSNKTIKSGSGWYQNATAFRYWNGNSFTSSATCLNWVDITPSAGSATSAGACGQSLGATKRYYTDNLVVSEIIYSDAGYTNWTTTANYYYRYSTAGGTNSTGQYFRVSNTTATVSEVGSCPVSTTTTTTTVCGLDLFGFEPTPWSTATQACDNAIDYNEYYMDSLDYTNPQAGDIVYTDCGTTTFNGGSNWFYSFDAAYALRIGTVGNVITATPCF